MTKAIVLILLTIIITVACFNSSMTSGYVLDKVPADNNHYVIIVDASGVISRKVPVQKEVYDKIRVGDTISLH